MREKIPDSLKIIQTGFSRLEDYVAISTKTWPDAIKTVNLIEYSLEYPFSIPIYYYYEELSVKPASLRL